MPRGEHPLGSEGHLFRTRAARSQYPGEIYSVVEQEEFGSQDIANNIKSTHRNLLDTLQSHKQGGAVYLCDEGLEYM